MFGGILGAGFGLLTLALFIGMLPSYFGVNNLFSGNITGALSALASLLMLGAAIIILKIKGEQNNEYD